MTETVTQKLRELTESYKKIYALSQEKKEAVVANDAEKVKDIVKQEWDLLSEASSSENDRIKAVSEALGCSLTEAQEPGRLEELLEKSTPAEKQALEEAAAELRSVLKEQQALNAELKELIDLQLEYTDYMVNTVFQEPQVSSIYGTSGQVLDDSLESGSLHGIIDSQV